MATKEKREFLPGRSYDIQLNIKGIDYSKDIYRVTIASSITSPYQTITLEIFISPKDIILKKLYGQDSIKLAIRLIDQSGVISEQIDFNLLLIDASFSVPISAQEVSGSQEDRSSLSIVGVCKEAFKTITTYTNHVLLPKPKENYNNTLRDIITYIVQKNTNTTLKYDTENENKNIVEQIIIPPTTVYKNIMYLDNLFGLYTGVPVIFCSYDNILYIKNLTAKMKKAQIFTVYQISSGDPENENIIKKSLADNNFYTYSPLETTYSGNSAFSVLAPTLKHIVAPRDTLFYTITQDLKSLCSNYGLISGNTETFVNSLAISSQKRIKYYTFNDGFDYDSTFAISKIAKLISNLSTISVYIERNLQIKKLMKVGEVVKLDARTLEYTSLSGKYILKSSQIDFYREGEWQTTANLNLMRTNKSLT